MTDRKKLELELNQPRTFELLYDNPKIGDSRYGKYFLYALADIETGETFSFFATEQAHAELIMLEKGAKVIITKTAKQQNGSKIEIQYNVTPYKNGSAVDEAIANLPANIAAKQANGIQPHPQNGNGTGAHIHDEGRFFTEMLQSFEDAAKIQKQYQGADLNRTAVTLFIARSRQNAYPSYPAS